MVLAVKIITSLSSNNHFIFVMVKCGVIYEVPTEFLSTSGRSCNRPTRSRSSVVFLGPRANAEVVPKFHVTLNAYLSCSPHKINIKISSLSSLPHVKSH
jgi:hypothetical protein